MSFDSANSGGGCLSRAICSKLSVPLYVTSSLGVNLNTRIAGRRIGKGRPHLSKAARVLVEDDIAFILNELAFPENPNHL